MPDRPRPTTPRPPRAIELDAVDPPTPEPAGAESGHAHWLLTRMLGVAGRLVTERHHAYLARHGLTPASFVALEALDGGPLAHGALAARAGVEQQTMSRTVDRMARDGLVVRRPVAGDRRRVAVERTAAGAATYRAARADAEAFAQTLLGRVADPERLRRDLGAVLDELGAARWRKRE